MRLLTFSAIGSMMNGLQSLPVWRDYFGNPRGVHLGLINAIYPIGSVVSLPITSFLSDKFGRKFPIYLGLVGIVIGAALQAASQSYAMLVLIISCDSAPLTGIADRY